MPQRDDFYKTAIVLSRINEPMDRRLSWKGVVSSWGSASARKMSQKTHIFISK